MDRKRLNKLKREVAQFRRSSPKAADLERLARRLGRQKRTDRGKEPIWESTVFNDLFPLSIPHHGSKDLAVGTKHSILDALEDDILNWEERLAAEESSDENETNKSDGDKDDSESK
jgi:hypothetical protein